MPSNKVFEDTIYQTFTLMKQGELYDSYLAAIGAGKSDFKISQVYTKKNYSTDWIDVIEDCIVALDTIVRNPRKFITIEEDIVDVSLARSISVESVKHLAQHTNLISSVKKDGTIIPSKILNTSKEESYEIYENRFVYTLLLKVRDFIDLRFTAIKDALMQSGELGVEIASDFAIDKNKVHVKLETNANFPFDAVVKKKQAGLSDVERITRMNGIISDFLSSVFAKEMRSCALVRPPIQRTNVILKDPNFKKALVLWQYIETAEKMEFKVETVTETTEMNPVYSEKFSNLIYLDTVLMQSIASTREEGESVESALQKEKVIADEYVTKNIDDYVPDDFPLLKLDVTEIVGVYHKAPAARLATVTQIRKVNAAVDRAIRQQRINKLKEDSVMQQKLIAKQLEEEEAAKKLALREQRDLIRLKKQEEARKRFELRRKQRETEEEALKIAQQARKLEQERQQQEKKQEDLRRMKEKEYAKIDNVILQSAEFIKETESKLKVLEARNTALRDEYARDKSDFDHRKLAFDMELNDHKATLDMLRGRRNELKQRSLEQKRLVTQHERDTKELLKLKSELVRDAEKTYDGYLSERARLMAEIDTEKTAPPIELLPDGSEILSDVELKKKTEFLGLVRDVTERAIQLDNIDAVRQMLGKVKFYTDEDALENKILLTAKEYGGKARKIKRNRFIARLKKKK